MMAHNKSMEHGAATMEKRDPTAQPGEAAMDKGDKPVMTHHHPDGTHTTVHESGQEHNHENLEALKQHLDQFIDEEQGEGEDSDGMDKPEYE
jgi:hypothetical protein